MRRDYAWKLGLIALLVLGCVAVLYFMPIRQGLDLQGGANIVLAADQRADLEMLQDVQRDIQSALSKAGLQGVPVKVRDDREGYVLQLGSLEAARSAQAAIGNHLTWKSDMRTAELDLSYGQPRQAGDGYELNITVERQIDREAMERAKAVVDMRVNGLGLSETVVQLDNSSNRITVQLPGANNAAQATESLIRVARLTFRIDGRIVLDGGDLQRATATYGGNYNAPILQLILTKDGATRFEKITGDNVGKNMAIYLDDEQLMNPVIQDRIAGGRPIIDFNGSKSIDKVKVYAVQMNSGALPVPLKVLASSSVGPTLGREAINASMLAGIASLILVFAFMIAFYGAPGAIADIALVVYALLSLAAVVGLRGVLTLPGIAGYILAVGMAVDGNIIIFERVKDEMRNGKSARAAIQAGFSRAFWPIFDSNLTTILTGGVLFFFGTGLIRGFATTLVIGVAMSMFTVLVVTRIILDIVVDRMPDRFARYFGA